MAFGYVGIPSASKRKKKSDDRTSERGFNISSELCQSLGV
jgi:hypothetical protein